MAARSTDDPPGFREPRAATGGFLSGCGSPRTVARPRLPILAQPLDNPLKPPHASDSSPAKQTYS